MTFGNMLLSPSDRLNDLFKKNPDGIEIQSIASILEQSRDLVKKRLNDLSIGTTKTWKDRKKYIYLTPEWVESLIQAFVIMQDINELTENIISEWVESFTQPFAIPKDIKNKVSKNPNAPKLTEKESRMICRNAMEKYGISKWQWTEITRSHASLFAATHIRSILVYYVPEENIQAFEEVIKTKKELKSTSKNNITK